MALTLRRRVSASSVARNEKFLVTFFFNDYREEPFAGEDRELVPSRKDCATYDEKPEMSAYGIRDASVAAIKSGKYGLIVINFANPDMVGHTGVLEACIEACEIVDDCVGDLLAAIDEVGGSAVITADHGETPISFGATRTMAPIQRTHSILLNSSFTVIHTRTPSLSNQVRLATLRPRYSS